MVRREKTKKQNEVINRQGIENDTKLRKGNVKQVKKQGIKQEERRKMERKKKARLKLKGEYEKGKREKSE